ncbi:carboxypeptidase-like regulatory domain-containing protein [Yeosuana sp.]|uniref:carboxypeptidase-like regulatory domain-containing protein n=1 Tax=Yeosuana sp. TaxID=2529388 RepID=UPI00405532E8
MNFCKLSLIIILLCFFHFDLLFAQKTINGCIRDSENKSPIESVDIYIKNSTTGTISNSEGKFVLNIPKSYIGGVIVISSMGYKKEELRIDSLSDSFEFELKRETIELDDVLLITQRKKITGKEIVEMALQNWNTNFSDSPFLAEAFLRHRERNEVEYKWLIESALSIYDPGIKKNSSEIKINVDETRRSYDNREIDTLLLTRFYLANKGNLSLREIKKIKDGNKLNFSEVTNWNDLEYNNIEYLISGQLNIIRNRFADNSIFGKDIFETHTFTLDTILFDNEKILYKIKISPGKKMIDLKLGNTYNKGFIPIGWLYVYKENYKIKEIEYALLPGSKSQKARSRVIFNSKVMHKINLKFVEYNNKVYPKYFSYQTPKFLNSIFKPDSKGEYNKGIIRDEGKQYYYTKQEILFTEIITDEEKINVALQKNKWNSDIFKSLPYNKTFWDAYNVLMETDKEERMAHDLNQVKNSVISD